jgi:hypothetical protein
MLPSAPFGADLFTQFPTGDSQMKYVVQLYVAGKVFNEEVQASNPKDARETALARNPKAKIVGVNVKF